MEENQNNGQQEAKADNANIIPKQEDVFRPQAIRVGAGEESISIDKNGIYNGIDPDSAKAKLSPDGTVFGFSALKIGTGVSGSLSSVSTINLGFRPKGIMFKAKANSSNNGATSDGVISEDGSSCIYQYWNTVPATPRLDTDKTTSNNRVILLYDGSNYTIGECEITDTGFEITWTQVSFGQAFYQYIAIS